MINAKIVTMVKRSGHAANPQVKYWQLATLRGCEETFREILVRTSRATPCYAPMVMMALAKNERGAVGVEAIRLGKRKWGPLGRTRQR